MVTGPLAPLAHSWVADTPHESPGSSQTHPSIPPTSAPAFSLVASNRSLAFAKTPQDIESCPRNNVTGGSACYSFQTHFEFWRGTNLLSLFPHVPRSPRRHLSGRVKVPASKSKKREGYRSRLYKCNDFNVYGVFSRDTSPQVGYRGATEA